MTQLIAAASMTIPPNPPGPPVPPVEPPSPLPPLEPPSPPPPAEPEPDRWLDVATRTTKAYAGGAGT